MPRRSAFWIEAQLSPLALFLLTLLALVGGTIAVRALVPGLGERSQLVSLADRPSDRDHYLAHDIGGHVDHHVHYFGLDAEVVRRMREADVLFLGNSRLMFAMRPAMLRPFFAAQGVRHYLMGFGFREADQFPLAIIRKFDLRPKLVVVNADGFFAGGLSPWAELVVRDTLFAARKWQWEAERAHAARRVVHDLVPNWLQLFGHPGLRFRRGFIAYRARLDGTWAITPWDAGDQLFSPPPLDGPVPGDAERSAARAFKAELDRRGSRLVLTRVPTPVPMPGAGPARFADLLNVPLVTADVRVLSSSDGSHLDESSAHDWSRAFAAALAPYLSAAALRAKSAAQ